MVLIKRYKNLASILLYQNAALAYQRRCVFDDLVARLVVVRNFMQRPAPFDFLICRCMVLTLRLQRIRGYCPCTRDRPLLALS